MKKTATIEQEIENVISTMPENEVEVQTEQETETQEAPQPEKPREPVKIEITDDAQPMKTRRRRRTKQTSEPEPEPPVQILSGETLLELTSIITSRAAALVISVIARQQKFQYPENLTPDFFALTEQEKKNLSQMADRAAEKMAASGDPVIIFFAGVLTVVGVKAVIGYQMIEAWNKEKKS